MYKINMKKNKVGTMQVGGIVQPSLSKISNKTPLTTTPNTSTSTVTCDYSIPVSQECSDRPADQRQHEGILILRRKQIQFGEFLGNGNFGEVYKVNRIRKTTRRRRGFFRRNNTEDDLPCPQGRYAVKVLNKKLYRKPDSDLREAASDLMEEAKYLLRCRGHPYIVQIHGMSTPTKSLAKSDSIFVMMDHMHGTLDRRIVQWKKQKIRECSELHQHFIRCTRYALQISSALDFLHRQRLIFRDVKPENIGFIADPDDALNDKVQLFDFGFCRELPQSSVTKEAVLKPKAAKKYFRDWHKEDGYEGTFQLDVCGSPMYMAGEVFLTKGLCNLKADVYSWAMTFFEMLFLQDPFEISSITRLHKEVYKMGVRPSLSRARIVEYMPASITSLLRQAWSAYPSERPTSGECCEELEHIIVELQNLKRQ